MSDATQAAPVELPVEELLAEAHDLDPAIEEAPFSDERAAFDTEEPGVVGPAGQSGLVGFYLPTCAGGFYSSFTVPKQAFPYTFRFAFVLPTGERRLSGFGYVNRSAYPPTVLWGRWPYPIVRGSRQVYAYWWTGDPSQGNTGPAYWNYINVRC